MWTYLSLTKIFYLPLKYEKDVIHMKAPPKLHRWQLLSQTGLAARAQLTSINLVESDMLFLDNLKTPLIHWNYSVVHLFQRLLNL